MNRITRHKLHLSKWTAVHPTHRERHFIVIQVLDNEEGEPKVVLEAVHSKRVQHMVWTELKNDTVWQMGWR